MRGVQKGRRSKLKGERSKPKGLLERGMDSGFRDFLNVRACLRRKCCLERRGRDCTPVVVSKDQRRSMGAKFSVLPQRNETAAQMSERGTLAVYSERLVLIGSQLVVRRHTAAIYEG